MSVTEGTFCRSAPWRLVTGRVILPWVLEDIRPRGELLDLGAGSARWRPGMPVGSPDLRITVTDIGPVMVKAARLRLADQPEVCVGGADVTTLPFDDESFDYVASFLMLHHVVDLPRALAEAARVLPPGGRLFGYDLIKTRLAEWLHWADRSPHRLIALEQLRASMEQVGHEAVRVRPGPRDHVMRFSAEKPSAPLSPPPR